MKKKNKGKKKKMKKEKVQPRDFILAYALQNAVKYDGKANAGAVIGKILSENPELKREVESIRKEVLAAIKQINNLKKEEQISMLVKISPQMLQENPKREEKKELPAFKNVGKGVVMRFEPSPSGPLHIGHAYVLGINHLYCQKYKGKLVVRISDTNPENIYEKAYDMIKGDANWLTNNKVEFGVQSDKMKVYYKYAEMLLNQGNSYVCTCNNEEFKKLLDKSEACPCRNLEPKEQIKRWKEMFGKTQKGFSVMRIKTDLHDKNPALRDWPAFRINESRHARQGTKYRVWPLMNFAVAVDDIEQGVTHRISGKDHRDNAKKQEYIFKYLNKPLPENIFLGRINFAGLPVSCTQTREAIERGEYSGWDDIRLPFLVALKRRGYQAESLLKFAEDMGVSEVDKTVPKEEFFKILDSINRRVIEGSDRHFFVEQPVKIHIKGAEKIIAEAPLHPDHPERGARKFETSDELYISSEDYGQIRKDGDYRLMHLLNFKSEKDRFTFISKEMNKELNAKMIHWLPADGKQIVNVEIIMPDASIHNGFAERGVEKLKEGEIIQFERVGFCILDKKTRDKLVFWFVHK